MSTIKQQAIHLLTSRFARNSYFWLFMLWLKANDACCLQEVLLITWIWALVLMMFCFNNFVLVPQLLAKNKTVMYLLAAEIATAIESIVYTATIKFILIHFPTATVNKISLVVNDVSYELSVKATLTEALSSFFLFFLFAKGFYTGAWYLNNYLKQQKILEEIKRKQAEAELHFLKTQMSPHFLFNTLNNIYGLAGKKSDRTQDVVLKLSDILRYLLYESNVPFISFEKEKQIILSYVDLEVLQLSDADNLSFTIEADGDYNIPPLLWLPILENAFKYGTQIISNGCPLKFEFLIKDGVVYIYSENNYKDSMPTKTGGIGLTNLRKRLQLLYPDKHTLTINREQNIFSIQVAIDLS